MEMFIPTVIPGKTYVSYKDGENKQGVAVDIYYLPNGMDTIIHKINKAISKIHSIPWR